LSEQASAGRRRPRRRFEMILGYGAVDDKILVTALLPFSDVGAQCLNKEDFGGR